MLGIDACFPDSVVGFTADEQTTTYVQVWLSFLKGVLEAKAPQSAQKNINLTVLRGLPVPSAPKGMMFKFHERVRAVETQMHGADSALRETNELIQALGTRAFRGEL